jgi:hypothetical protein
MYGEDGIAKMEKIEKAKQRLQQLKEIHGLQTLTDEEARIRLQEIITNNKEYAAMKLPEYSLHGTQSK